jgi:signal transduction histidine kinase
MHPSRPQPLSLQLALVSLVSILSLGALCGVGVVCLRQLSRVSSTALHGEMELFDNTEALQDLLYQKGFVAYYMLTGEREWLVQLERSRDAFARWLERAQSGSGPSEARQILLHIAGEYGAFDETRRQTLAALEAGKRDEALQSLKSSYTHHQTLLFLCQRFSQVGHRHAQDEMALTQRSLSQRTAALLLASVAGILASLAMGYLLARRIGKPIYELQLQVASAVQKTSLQVVPGRDGLDALGDHMAALLRKLEETDAGILAQRQRLIQSEKMSAIGEVAAKLAHEILNPLAGMKAAVQLLLRAPGGEAMDLHPTANALDREITRVDQLVRRLINYAKPLTPRLQPCTVRRLFDAVSEAMRTEMERTGTQLAREEAPDLPTLELDPLLMTQALVNLVTNAFQATPPGGQVRLCARRLTHLGKEHLSLQVLDEGPGLSSEQQAKLFHPFFTTKPKGHGLGLAVTQNIVMEHGGEVTAHSRADGPGAQFEILLPLSPSPSSSAVPLEAHEPPLNSR